MFTITMTTGVRLRGGGARGGLVGHLDRVVEDENAVAFNPGQIFPGSGSQAVDFKQRAYWGGGVRTPGRAVDAQTRARHGGKPVGLVGDKRAAMSKKILASNRCLSIGRR